MYDIVTLGGASVDVFVHAKNEQLKHKDHLDLCYHLNDKILIDKLVFTTGGGGTNTAVAFSRLGLKTGFIGLVGNDSNARIILDELKKEKIAFLGSIKKGNTGFSIVLAGQSDRSILVSRELSNKLSLKDISPFSTRWLYVSAMIGTSLVTSKALIAKEKTKRTKIAFNMGPYLAKEKISTISNLLNSLDIFTLNLDEAILLSKKKKIEDIFKFLSNFCPGIIVITDGQNPVYAFFQNEIFIEKVKPQKVIDSTGCGDAFSSGFTYSIMRNLSIQKAMQKGLKEAYSVLGSIGAKNNLLRTL